MRIHEAYYRYGCSPFTLGYVDGRIPGQKTHYNGCDERRVYCDSNSHVQLGHFAPYISLMGMAVWQQILPV